MFQPRLPHAAFTIACLTPSLALADQLVPSGDVDPVISYGEPAPACSWPTAVAVQNGGSLCTGTLIDPWLVVYAAHCGASNTTITFGESTQSSKKVTPEYCETYSGWAGVASDQAHDWAYCKLAAPITDLPVTPAVYGCENSILQVGTEVAIAGFGQTLQGGAGSKNWALTQLTGVNIANNTINLGGGGLPSVCSGDSGGPAYVKFPDGSWHAFGIASTVSGGCGGFGTHSLIEGAIPWIEQQTGIDVTPCHDQDGTWNPTPLCQGFYAGDAGIGYGTWGPWCEGTPRSGSSGTCGDPFDAVPDDTPPTVAITYPAWGDMFDAGASFDILADADDVGWGVMEVGLTINGFEMPTDSVEPWEFKNATFPNAGVYTMIATAVDWAGHETESEPVAIGVGGADPGEMPSDTGGDGDGDGDGDGGTGGGEDGGSSATTTATTTTTGVPGTGGGDDGDASGCACNVDEPNGSLPAAAGFGLLLLGLRRRRA